MRIAKDCPKCRGDMFIDRDRYGWHKQCLQCGYLIDLAKAVNAKQNPLLQEKDTKLIKTA
jgi:DNA-directed RNA polymerase subunit M/transcription elongation factor TFIIS